VNTRSFELIEFCADVPAGFTFESESRQIDDRVVAYFEAAESLLPGRFPAFQRLPDEMPTANR